MKYRKSFVTNSSSSSYTCSYCGHTESGWDLSLSECEMFECENGHIVCEDHIDMKKLNDKDFLISLANKLIDTYQKNIDEYDNGKKDKYSCREMYVEYISDLKDTINELNNGNDIITISYIDEDYRYNLPSTICPLCKLEDVEDYMILKYLLKKMGNTKDSIINEIKNKFGSYNDLLIYTRGK